MKQYVQRVKETRQALRDADDYLMTSTSEAELEERNEAAWEAAERYGRALLGKD